MLASKNDGSTVRVERFGICLKPKKNSPFFGFSDLFDQTGKVSKTQHVKFASQKEPFQEHMSVGVRFLDDHLHVESVVFRT